METWEHLTPDQKQSARRFYSELRTMPQDRRQTVNNAIREMRNMTPEQRDQFVNSDRVRSNFSPEERDVLNGISRLPLASENPQPAPNREE